MFDLPQIAQPIARPAGLVPFFANLAPDRSLPFALTVAKRNMGSMMAGESTSIEVDRFATLVDAMHAAVMLSGEFGPNPAPALIAILDRDQRLVLAGTLTDGAVAWCHPVASASEARAVVNRPGFTGGQNSRRIAHYGTDTKEEDLEAVFTRVPRACGAAGDGTPR